MVLCLGLQRLLLWHYLPRYLFFRLLLRLLLPSLVDISAPIPSLVSAFTILRKPLATRPIWMIFFKKTALVMTPITAPVACIDFSTLGRLAFLCYLSVNGKALVPLSVFQDGFSFPNKLNTRLLVLRVIDLVSLYILIDPVKRHKTQFY